MGLFVSIHVRVFADPSQRQGHSSAVTTVATAAPQRRAQESPRQFGNRISRGQPGEVKGSAIRRQAKVQREDFPWKEAIGSNVAVQKRGQLGPEFISGEFGDPMGKLGRKVGPLAVAMRAALVESLEPLAHFSANERRR
jgi:hypothetical protein